ncbi:cell division topological specificity factor MinE [Phytophthora nicotianae CJ01A1]|uniref:Cell division topological specificity factor MinE n=5 Tax=Phytophthora nicotianae TaxID=4792 RepID=W2PJ53_PHYN3|nr:cell division topological specificity factor MinE [Phytophthora nicotianae INRA-310]ETK74105.1 cell division topological specificity factor MinE [Phytophthora nicotianae]ETO62536.1 cell division topological specificity factor MinE [Phytophthora nicotianae P1976]ETP03610.1 cell division topological specificity factor MinE [Phytophthora nicotianae CJ01A1]ETP31774.1 cell division topological specificity factor MinE [Phytophthora nicotianae P10297]KUG00764.1 Cell division topological specificit
MAARVGASSRHGAKKWLASLFGEAEQASSSKSVAKERLQIILAHQRGSQVLAGVDLAALQKELLECVQRHIKVANGANINIAVKNEGHLDIFEMQVPVDGDKAVEGRKNSR